VLLVEDNLVDVELTRIAFEDAGVANELVVVGDGTDALAYLRGDEPYGQAARPELVLLDLHLPKLDGAEVISQLSGDPRFDGLPIVVLADPNDAELADLEDRCLGALPKPIDVDRLAELVRSSDACELVL
jgi:CheY-like chemotaxis protein